MDDESTYHHSCSRYVPNYVHAWYIDPVECLDTSRAKHTSAVIARPPSCSKISPPLLGSEERGSSGREQGFNRDQTIGSSYDSVNTARDCGLQVCIQESVFVDTKLEEGSIERGSYTSLSSTCDMGDAV
jgi:hypothetical protein